MKMHKEWELLSAYIDGELSKDEIRTVERHLALCADCRREKQEFSGVKSLIRSVNRVAAPAHFFDRRRWDRNLKKAV